MLQTVALNKRNANQFSYEQTFAHKFELVKKIPNYQKLEKFAQKCIDLHCGDSLDGISARVYMDKINTMSTSEFAKWATSYAKNSK